MINKAKLPGYKRGCRYGSEHEKRRYRRKLHLLEMQLLRTVITFFYQLDEFPAAFYNLPFIAQNERKPITQQANVQYPFSFVEIPATLIFFPTRNHRQVTVGAQLQKLTFHQRVIISRRGSKEGYFPDSFENLFMNSLGLLGFSVSCYR